MPDIRSEDKPEYNPVIIVSIVAIFILALVAPRLLDQRSYSSESVGTFIVVSVTVVVTVLSIIGVIYKFIGLANPNQALGLPKGSIRALIAICIILIFCVVSLRLFSYIVYNKTYNAEGDLIGTVLNPEGIDFAQQLLTTLSTLVISLCSFYFGARTVETTREETLPAAKPKLNIVSPSSSVKLEKDLGSTLEPIKIETTPSGEAITWKVDPSEPRSLVQVQHNEFKYTRTKLATGTVRLIFALVKDSDVTDVLEVEIEEESRNP